MKPSLNLRPSQHLALTPQLQQSIRLLQLSTLELEQEIEQALAENPLLERESDWLDSPLRVAADGAVHLTSASAAADRGDDPPDQRAEADDHEYDEYDEYGETGETGGWSLSDFARAPAGDPDAEHAPYQLQEAMLSLREHLLQQAQLLSLSPRDRGLLQFLIESLDDNGYLPAATLDELAADLPAELEIEPDEIHTALKLLQSLEPAGIGARSPAECLGLQLLRQPASEIRDVALRLAASHLELLAARDFKRLKRALQTDEDTLKAAAQLIRALNPRPGQAFGGPPADYVVPDVIVRKGASGWAVALNPAVMPRLRVNDMYAQILKRNRDGDSGLQQKLQEARWMIRNIQQRFDTILRVAQAIVERQTHFFTDGEIAMRPLVLREIADTLGLHESTISRVTTSKYMATPLGTFELKYFFGSHVATEAGGAASSTAIRALIKQLVGAENSQRPLSDSKIADMLAEQGFVVARRTVAKYREALKIPAVNLRKAL